MAKRLIIAKISDASKGRGNANNTNREFEERKYVSEKFVSSVYGTNVKDTFYYSGIQYNNGGKQYSGLDREFIPREQQNTPSEPEKKISQKQETTKIKSKEDMIPSYYQKERYHSPIEKTTIVETDKSTVVMTPPSIKQKNELVFEEEITIKPSVEVSKNADDIFKKEDDYDAYEYYQEPITDTNENKPKTRNEQVTRNQRVSYKKSLSASDLEDIQIELYNPDDKIADLPNYSSERESQAEKPSKNIVRGYDTKHAPMSNVNKKKYRSKYITPPLSLLKRGAVIRQTDNSGTQFQKAIIDKTLNDFRIAGHVTNFHKGPTVTQFEIMLDDGVKVEKIKTIERNIQKDLEVKTIRIQAPIPGKNTVGIEVPNMQTDIVLFGEMLAKQDFFDDKNPLNVILGLDVSGVPIYMDIAQMPHALVAGTTGSGKSVCINSIILSILYKAHPDDVKLILIDPKLIEFSNYEGIPHLATPVITEPKVASAALGWAVEEMGRRYELFRTVKRTNITNYNQLADEEPTVMRIPYIVIIIDELADLLMDPSSGDVEEHIQRLAQKARAAGIHLIVATQRPSTDIIKGSIKGNIPTKIAFMVNKGVDSQVILDHLGAEKLLGKGDMLYNDSVNEKRIQGAYVSLDEIVKVTEYVRDLYPCSFMFEESDLKIRNIGENGRMDYREDELFEPIARFVVENNQASINRIQKTFEIGFNRAQAIMDGLEEMGIVSESLGSRARNVLVTIEELEDILLGD